MELSIRLKINVIDNIMHVTLNTINGVMFLYLTWVSIRFELGNPFGTLHSCLLPREPTFIFYNPVTCVNISCLGPLGSSDLDGTQIK